MTRLEQLILIFVFTIALINYSIYNHGWAINLFVDLTVVTCLCDCSVKQKINYVKTTSAKEMI